jgi:hypothetical protein
MDSLRHLWQYHLAGVVIKPHKLAHRLVLYDVDPLELPLAVRRHDVEQESIV